MTISRYLEVADVALRLALADVIKPLPRQTIRANIEGIETTKRTLQSLIVQLKQGIGIPLTGRQVDPTLESDYGSLAEKNPGYVRDPPPHLDGVAVFMHSRSNHSMTIRPFRVEQDGYYDLRVRGWATYNDHGTLRPSDRTETVAYYIRSGRLLGRCDLPPGEATTATTRVWLNKGERVDFAAVSLLNKSFGKSKPGTRRYNEFEAPGIALQWFEMEGPMVPGHPDASTAPWPPNSHRRLLGDLPLEPSAKGGELPYRVVVDDPTRQAKRLLMRFTAAALRRPVVAADYRIAWDQIQTQLAAGQSFIDAMLAGYVAVLVSPAFLLREESPGRLDDWALASRLSYFLNNGPPDAELRRVAARGQLSNPAVLRAQAVRLIGVERFDRFVEHFLDHWLSLQDIRLTEPDTNLYPEYNGYTGESMVAETRAFFEQMVRRNLPVSHIYDSSFLMLNQRLATLYNVPGVRGHEIRPVAIDNDSLRGGLLTQASVLKVTANGTNTSPVVRGVFVMDRFLGDPLPPPPAAVPAIEPDLSGATTIGQQLAAHRADPSCAVCHRKIDPPGFALESFDVMGGYRTTYRIADDPDSDIGQKVDKVLNARPVRYRMGLPVQCDGELPGPPTGSPVETKSFRDINEFRDLLRNRDREMADNLMRRLLVYATGHPVDYADAATFDAMLDSIADDGYPVGSMIAAIIASDLFSHK